MHNMTEPLSISRINCYLRCPQSFYYKYILKLQKPNCPSFTKGLAVHSGADTFYKAIIANQQIEVTDAIIAGAKKFDELTDNTDFGDKDPKAEKAAMALMIEEYINQIAIFRRPIYSEIKILSDIDGIPFQGIIDLIEENHIIRDTKTASKKPAENLIVDGGYALQLAAYSLLYEKQFGVMPTSALDVIALTKTKCEVYSQLDKKTDEDINTFKEIIANVFGLIINEVFYPNPLNQFCSEKCCSYYGECKSRKI